MSVAIVIPARFASTRYPGKPLVPLTGATGEARSLVRRSWDAARAVRGVDRVVVATDDERIAQAARAFGAEVAMTPEGCANGTERCAAVLDRLAGIDLVVNLQGDAPLTPPVFVEALIAAMADGEAAVATPVLRAAPAVRRRLFADQAAGRVGGTTAALGERGRALYFSKSVIPYVAPDRRDGAELPLFLHVGVYVYRPATLAAYAGWPAGTLEQLEGLEQLRFLERGVAVRAVEVRHDGDLWELNNPEDVPVIEAALVARGMA